MDSEEANLLAIEYYRQENRNHITVEANELPHPGAYGFEPEGWVTFSVVDETVFMVGGDEYVAVNLATKEVWSLGIIGD